MYDQGSLMLLSFWGTTTIPILDVKLTSGCYIDQLLIYLFPSPQASLLSETQQYWS